jgi:hypothetical protein
MTQNIEQIAFAQFAVSSTIFDEKIQSHQLMCRIFNAYAGPEEKNHNCLGCNFDDLTQQISTFLGVAGNYQGLFSLHQASSIYFLLLNGLWERVTDVFDIISVPQGYRSRHYGPLIRARRWANFFKHPKEFGWLVHHPDYTLEGTDHCTVLLKNVAHVRIDDEFIKKFYSCESAKGLAKEFQGKEAEVIVVLPHMEQFTNEICDCLTNFVDVVTKNPVYFEILNDKATIIDYFQRLCDIQKSPTSA